MKKYILGLCFLCVPVSGVWANMDVFCETQVNVEITANRELQQCFDRFGCVTERNGDVTGCDQARARDCCQTTFEQEWVQNCDEPPPTSEFGDCEGGVFGSWDRGNHTRRFEGVECRTVSSSNRCTTDTRNDECQPCGYEEEDLGSPSCESEVVDWASRPLESVVVSCEDAQSGCDADSYENGRLVEGVGVTPGRACDHAGNCVECAQEEVDITPPTCESVVDWSARPVESIVLSCEDDLSGCDENSYENGTSLSGGGVAPARACDNAGNCVECSLSGVDTTPPTCRATFFQPGRWHRDDKFEINGGPVRCWLESCEDPDPDGEGGEVASGCLPIPTGEDTPKIYEDETYGTIIVEQDPLIQQHRDFCVIQVCDNAGNCNTCQSPEIAYDGTDVCRSAIGFCGACDEDDYDCRCISGERDMCTNTGSINCYADPFNERCPGFDNPACLTNAFIPGCPVFNPCYPETNRDHPKSNDPNCPADAIRFCTRNPYHYGCNEACKFGLIRCVPDVPENE